MVKPLPSFDSGLVVAGYGRHYTVEAATGLQTSCRPRGKRCNLVVGDRVQWNLAGDEANEGVIERVCERRNLLYRQDARKTKAFAANLDQLLVLLAADPVFSEEQLSRVLVAADSAGIAAHIVLNKADLPQFETARERLVPYANMGVAVVEISLKLKPQEARRVLAPLLANKASLLLGPSGSGKSTMVNLMVPEVKVQVGEVSRALNTGRHVTTSTQWYWLDSQRTTALIDSPGFQEFGLRQIKAADLSHHMPDLRGHLNQCRFYNCTHRHEPGCGVLAAFERGEINASRMRIYKALWEELS